MINIEVLEVTEDSNEGKITYQLIQPDEFLKLIPNAPTAKFKTKHKSKQYSAINTRNAVNNCM